MSAQGEVLKLKTSSAGAFARRAHFFLFAATPVRRLSSSDLESKGFVIGHESIDGLINQKQTDKQQSQQQPQAEQQQQIKKLLLSRGVPSRL